MNNCISWSNVSDTAGNDIYREDEVPIVRYCCASDGLTNGTDGCTTNDPLFVNAATGDYQLQPPVSASVTINGGNNTYAPTNEMPHDLAGNPRIVDTTVDMGAYECQDPTAIVLFDFELVVDDGTISVAWRTASEVDTIGYLLERRNADGTWSRLGDGLIPALGEGGLGAEYTIVDPAAVEGVRYTYRLTEIEADGTQTEYEFEREVRGEFRVSPLTVDNGQLTIRWLSWAGETYRVLRADVPGGDTVCVADELAATPPENRYEEDVHGCDAGFYVIQKME